MFGKNGLAYAKAYYAAVAENALRTRPDVIGHFDLVVKPNARGALFDEESPAYRAAALEALDACCEAGAILEVNTGGVFRGWRSTFYPAPFLLRRAAEKGMRATVSADAHCAEALCFGFAAARVCAVCGRCGAAPFAKRRCEKRCAPRAKRLAKM